MTMSQFATAVHGIGALVLALYIYPMVSKSLDSELQDFNCLDNIYAIFVGRLVAFTLATIVFIVFYFKV